MAVDASGAGNIPIVTEGHALRRNALGLPAITFQGITHMAPAAGVIFSAPFIATNAGAALPLAFFLALVICLLIASSIAQLAKHLPSAGGYYTYISRGLSPSLGFLTGWLYFLYDPVVPALVTVFTGSIFHDTIKSLFGIEFPWWLFTIIVFGALGLLTYVGVRPSTRTAIAFGLGEVLITLAISFALIAKHGVTGHDLSYTFTLAGIPGGLHGLAFGMIFSVLSYTGFEATAPLAEETRDPRRNIKWAVLLSTLAVGIYYLIFSFATVIGWGANATITTFGSAASPYNTLASGLWGGPGSVILLLAILNSAFACAVSGQNAVIRVYYKMAHVGVLPKALSRVHPRHRTPHAAIIFQTIVNLAVGLGLGFWLGPVNTFGFLGTMITVGLIFVYGAGMVAVPVFYRREHPDEINLWLTYVLPIIGIALMVPILYVSLVPPPAFPLNLPPYVDIAWFLIGLGVLAYLSRTRPRELEAGASAIFEDVPAEAMAPQGTSPRPA
jgi:amino acid transporter